MNRRSNFILSGLGLVLLGIAVAALLNFGPQIHLKLPGAPLPGYYRVIDFIDGDTISIDMNGKKETLRFIGVDTPETHDPRKVVQCFGVKAAAFTKSLIGKNNIRLEADPTNTNRDRYDRLLRYIYLPDGTLVNAEIIKQGYGFAYVSFPFTKMEDFKQYQQSARQSGKGLWSECQPAENQYGGYTSNSAQ